MNLTSLQKQKIQKIGRENGLIFAVIYGSNTKGQKRTKSDLDIAVLTKKSPTPKDFYTLFSQFSEAFKGENVDLRFLNGADPFFRFEVVKDGKLIYGNKEKFQEYFAYAYKSFVDDAQPLLELQREIIYQKQSELERAIL